MAIREKALGPDHPELLFSYSGLGNVYRRVDREDESEQAFREALRILAIGFPPGHPHEGITRTNLAVTLRLLERWDESVAEYRAASVIQLGAGDPATAIADSEAASFVLQIAGRCDEAVEQGRHALALHDEHFPGSIIPRMSCYMTIAMAMVEGGRYSEAMPLLDEALSVRTAELGEDGAPVGVTRCWRGRALGELGDLDTARRELEQGRAIVKAAGYETHREYGMSAIALGRVLLAQGDAASAAELIDEIGPVDGVPDDIADRAVAHGLADAIDYHGIDRPPPQLGESGGPLVGNYIVLVADENQGRRFHIRCQGRRVKRVL